MTLVNVLGEGQQHW